MSKLAPFIPEFWKFQKKTIAIIFHFCPVIPLKKKKYSQGEGSVQGRGIQPRLSWILEDTICKKQQMQLVSGKGMPGYDWKKPTRGGEEHGTSVTLHVTLQHRILKSRTVTDT